jgi:hypothetical protein
MTDEMQKLKEVFVKTLEKDIYYYPKFKKRYDCHTITDSVKFVLGHPRTIGIMFSFSSFDAERLIAGFSYSIMDGIYGMYGETSLYKETNFYKMLKSFMVIEKPDLKKFL